MMTDHYLREDELAIRWGISPRTLEKWRADDRGPAYHRIGATILYSPGDILDYEAKKRVETNETI